MLIFHYNLISNHKDKWIAVANYQKKKRVHLKEYWIWRTLIIHRVHAIIYNLPLIILMRQLNIKNWKFKRSFWMFNWSSLDWWNGNDCNQIHLGAKLRLRCLNKGSWPPTPKPCHSNKLFPRIKLMNHLKLIMNRLLNIIKMTRLMSKI